MSRPSFPPAKPLAALLGILHVAFAGALHGAEDDNAFFEPKVLPLLQKRCSAKDVARVRSATLNRKTPPTREEVKAFGKTAP